MEVRCVTDVFDGSSNIDRQSDLTKGKLYKVIEAEIFDEGYVSNRNQFYIKDDNGYNQWYYRHSGNTHTIWLEIVEDYSCSCRICNAYFEYKKEARNNKLESLGI
jgi:hypothetical protein